MLLHLFNLFLHNDPSILSIIFSFILLISYFHFLVDVLSISLFVASSRFLKNKPNSLIIIKTFVSLEDDFWKGKQDYPLHVQRLNFFFLPSSSEIGWRQSWAHTLLTERFKNLFKNQGRIHSFYPLSWHRMKFKMVKY